MNMAVVHWDVDDIASSIREKFPTRASSWGSGYGIASVIELSCLCIHKFSTMRRDLRGLNGPTLFG
jgi:hypothetical protein